MHHSRFFTRPTAVVALALFGLLPLAWEASEAAPVRALRAHFALRPHGALRPHAALRPHGALRPRASTTGGPPTAVPLYTFTSTYPFPDGRSPETGLVQGSDGSFYGVTQSGGSAGFGAVYRLTPDGKVSVLASFPNNQGGPKYPSGPLVEGLNPDGTPNGAFYGVTDSGGETTGKGTVYLFAPDAGSPTGYSITLLFSFAGGTDGGRPLGVLTVGRKADGTPDGYLYGTTNIGGAVSADNPQGSGVVYRVPKDGFAEDILHTFPAQDSTTGINSGGAAPRAALLQRHTATGWGAFYGTTASGGAGGYGTVFSLTSAGEFVTLHEFQDGSNGPDGRDPEAGLVQSADGGLYGTTFTGGGGAGGTVYRLAPDASSSTGFTYSQIVLMGEDSRFPKAALIEASDGKLYGTSEQGGSSYGGSVFRIDADPASPTGYSATAVHIFTNTLTEGGTLDSEVVQGTDGDLYGTTSSGGSASGGTLFRLNVVVPVVPAPTITPPIGYQVNTNNTATVTINGTNFVRGGRTNITIAPGTIDNITVNNGPDAVAAQLTIVLAKPLAAGDHTVTVTNPDGQFAAQHFTVGAAVKGPAPTIKSVTYHHYDQDGTTNVTVTGTGITPGATLTISGFFDGTAGTVFVDDAAHIHADLTKALPPGVHQITVANTDGQSSTTTLIAYGKPRIDGVVAITHKDGTVGLLVSGTNFPPNGYNGSDFGLLPLILDPSTGEFLETPPITSRQDQPGGAAPETPQQFVLNLGKASSGTLLVSVLSADGQFSGTPAVSTPSSRLKPHAAATDAPAIIYAKGRTQYQVFIPPTLIYTGDIVGDVVRYIVALVKALTFQLVPTANASPTQLLVGSVSLVQDNPSSLFSTAGSTTALAGLISNDGGSLISNDGGSLITQDGGGLISNDGGSFISQDGGNVISNDGGSLIGNDGGSIVATGGGNVISNDGGSIVATGGGNITFTKGLGASLRGGLTGNAAASARRPAIVKAVLGAVGSGPGSGGSLHILTGSAQPKAVKAHATAAADTPGSFTLTHTDEGPENGTGSTDAVVTGDDGAGHEVTLLRITYTPGQPDTITYVAPGVVVNPTDGTPNPKISNPAPTLTVLTSSAAPVGSPDLTLAVTGTLFEDGTVINWNGQPLATTVLSGTQATAVVPAALLSTQGTAPVTVTNPAPGGGTSAALDFTVGTVLTAPPHKVLHTFPAGLQMLSVTEDYARVGLSGALSDSSHPLVVWNTATGAYTPRTDLRPGVGYWVRLSKTTDLYDTGTPAPTGAPFSLPLQTGWNMIGDPFSGDVALANVQVRDAIGTQGTFQQAVSGGVLSGKLYTYPAGSTQYQSVGVGGSLSPFKGYWVYAFRACTLLMPSH